MKNFYKPKFYLMSIFLSMLVFSAAAQITVEGVVTDAQDNEPLIGVNVLIKGTSTGAVSGLDGSYRISVPDEASILVFSYIGYGNQEILVGEQRTINIGLESGSVLDEIVVTGYTTRKRGELTGSISTIDAKEIERTTNKDVAKSLAGKIPGLIVSDRGGYPGSTNDVSILIRGKSTLGNNAPLVLIDGIQAASFSHLSPSDIESLSVLKDGAAAIYGARAANGVILITTKRGRAGKPVINVMSTYSLSSLSIKPELMNSEQFAIYSNEAADRNGTSLPFSEEDISKYAAGNDPNFPSTDWYDATIAETSPEFRNTISISGGSEKVNYFVSGDYIDQEGLYKSGDLSFKQYQIRSNIDVQIHKKFKIGIDLSGRFGDRTEPGVDDGFIYKHIYVNEPTEVDVFQNGLVAWGGENGANPIIMSSSKSGFRDQTDNNLRGKFSFEWDLSSITEGLSAQGFAGVRRWTTNTKAWYTPWEVYTFQEGTNEYISQPGYSQQGTSRTLRETSWNFDELMLNATVHYNKTFGSHTVRGFIGAEQFESNQGQFWAERRGFPSDSRPELFAGSDEGQISNGGSSEFARLNYFGSLSYDFNKRYFVDFTIRHDGSGNFGPGKRFGTFPGVAVAWSIGDEAFMENTKSWISSMKLRASWALMGNDRIGPFQYLTRYNFGGVTNTAQPNFYYFGTSSTRYNGYVSSTVPNPDITWEKADMKNLGLSFAMFNYKLSADINYFYQKREDILITRNASIPDVAGITLPQENLGKVDNYGWEFQVGWNSSIGEVNYNLGANITKAKNEIVYMDEAADIPSGLRQEGFPLDSYIVYPTAGIFRDQAQVDATAVKKDGTVEGEPIYIDTNGDGVIDAGDRIRAFSSNVPEIQYGILGGLSYKGFDFNFLLQGQANSELFVFFDQAGAKPEYVFDERWTPSNRDSRYPRAFVQGDSYSGIQSDVESGEAADLYLHDASFLRLKEVEIGYTLDKEKTKFGNVRVFFRGLNLLTMFSDIYDLGLDPEAVSYNNFRLGTYPSVKSYSFGVNLTFE